MPLTVEEAATSIYANAVPPRALTSGLSALSELAEELTEINKLADKTLVDNRAFSQRVLGLLRRPKLPGQLEQFAVRVRKLAQRTQGENLFLDDDGLPLSMNRVDATFESLLRPLVNLSYILCNGAVNPPRRLNKEMMALIISKLANVLHELGEGLRSDLSHQPYQRALHAVSRLEAAEAAWKEAAKA